MSNLSESLAFDLKDKYAQVITTFNEDITNVLRGGFGLSGAETYDLLSRSEE